MSSKLYGIGVGPGDPELMTLKAIRAIELCDVIAVPGSESSDRTAFAVVEQYLTGKTLMECRFSMSRDEEKRKSQRTQVADQICDVLTTGKSVGFITIGDPAIYSTYGYIHQLVSERGFATEMIPGVSSFSAAAAALNQVLCEGNQPLHILPAGGEENIEQWLDLPGNKAIMKSGKNLKNNLTLLKNRGFAEGTKIATRCTMEGEQVFDNIEQIESQENMDQLGYFSIIVVKESLP